MGDGLADTTREGEISELDDCQDKEVEVVEDTDATVTSVSLTTGATLHRVKWRGDFWVTSAEVSRLVPQWRGHDLLHIMLTKKKLAHKVFV